ncbi:MAG: tRNA pseudouridine(38-40) synthase TruA [Anaerotignum sp.]|nr:tRNA pseudouridine(38-40) synthase TruA [Anaerotignum sp.]
MKRILLTIAFDGTGYSGWQKQLSPELITVEGELERALRVLFRSPELTCIGASRTDRGVHALGQRVTIDVDTTIPLEKIPMATRSLLPEDIIVVKAEEVPEDFHPRYDCVKKTYEYRIWNGRLKNPKERLYSTFVYHPLDVGKMSSAAEKFIGTYDFSAFCATGSSVSSTVRTIFDCFVRQEGNLINIYVTGDGFLYNMVRIMAGTLIDVGHGKISPNEILEIILSKDRQNAGQTAEPQGLTLQEIYYDFQGKSVDSLD